MSPDLPSALAAAVAAVRDDARAPFGTVLLLVPGDANGVLARQSLALAGPCVRVESYTPSGLVRHLAALALAPRRPEPAGWRRATVGVLVRELAAAGALGVHGDTLRLPGWRDELADTLGVLEEAGITAADLRHHPPADRALAERAALLATVSEALDARRREEGFTTAADEAHAALAAIDSGTPAGRAVGVVLLGDTRLAPPSSAVLRAFCARRPAARVVPLPLAALPTEPGGLAEAAPHARRFDVAPPPGALGVLQGRLFAEGEGAPIPVTEPTTVRLHTAPDDVREAQEAARAVQDAVLAGTPLDRIAVALASPERADVWVAALGRAGIPATWLTGPGLDRSPTARALALVAELAEGEGSVRRWYELLRQPGLRLRARLGPPGTAGRGRWRRILEVCGAVSGTGAIRAAVVAWAAEDGRPAEDVAAAQSLGVALSALAAELEALRPAAALGEHAARFAAFFRQWWARSQDREQVLQLLDGWAASRAGYRFALTDAVSELADALAGTARLEGALTDPTVRVLSPMALLGGAFDVVVMPGLAHGRFPAEPREAALLPDALLTHLHAATGVPLPLSAARRAEDRRRFAAAVSSCRGTLVLSWPETDLLDGKPRLAGAFVLDVASALLGRRAGYRDTAALARRVGSRARPHVDDPGRAIGGTEHLLALAARDTTAAVSWLAAFPTTRRLLALQRSPARLAAGLRDAWSGAVPPEVLPCAGLDGAPVAPWALADLLADPASFFFRTMLGAWKARRLPDGLDLLDRYAHADRVVAAARAALLAKGPLDAAFARAWEDTLDTIARRVPDLDPEDRALATALAQSAWRQAREHLGGLRGEALTLDTVRLYADLPWVVSGDVGIRAGRRLVQLDGGTSAPKEVPMAQLLAARGAASAGLPVTEAVLASLGGERGETLADRGADLRLALSDARHAAEAGEYRWGPRPTFRLADEQEETP